MNIPKVPKLKNIPKKLSAALAVIVLATSTQVANAFTNKDADLFTEKEVIKCDSDVGVEPGFAYTIGGKIIASCSNGVSGGDLTEREYRWNKSNKLFQGLCASLDGTTVYNEFHGDPADPFREDIYEIKCEPKPEPKPKPKPKPKH